MKVRKMLLLNGLSKTRVFLIFAVFLSSIISYISCLQSVETDSYYWVLPILFMAYVSIIMGIKTEGAFKAFSIGLVVFVFQFIIFTLIFLMLVFSAIGGFQSTADTDGTTNLLINHFEEEYDITILESDVILHSSEWTLADDFGANLIVKTTDPDFERFALRKVTAVGDERPMASSLSDQRYFICPSNEKDPQISIKDANVQKLICNLDVNSSDVIVTSKRVGREKSISTVAFPSQKIVWIAEIGW